MKHTVHFARPRHRRTLVSLGVLAMLAGLQANAHAQQSAAQADQVTAPSEASLADQARQVNAAPPSDGAPPQAQPQ
ncbi:MAG: hypothetical protein EOO78_08245, partial [Oxalobacteraceae bacterium]